jgi:P22 coat protein - gene protein 5
VPPNNFVNTSWVSMEILRLLVNKLVVSEYFNRNWEKDFNKEFAPGSTIQIKYPQRFFTINQMGYAPQGINRITTTVSLDTWIQVPFEWDDYERAVKLERSEQELRENYWEPAGAAIAQSIDSQAANWARLNTSNFVGILGADPTTVQTYYQARAVLEKEAAGTGKRCMLISTNMMVSLGSNITNVFHPADQITRMWKQGSIGILAGFDFFESNSLYNQLAGTWAGAVRVVGAGQSGAALVIQGTGGDIVNPGDKFSIQAVNMTNPMTYRSAGPLTPRTFTYAGPAPMVLTGGSDTIPILPPIYGPGSQYQNVDALPLNNAALTLFPGTTAPNGKTGTVGLGLTRDAFALVGGKLYLPKAVESAAQQQDPDSGIAIRKVIAWDPVRSMQVNRYDSLIGFGNLYQQNAAVAVLGA